MSEYWVTPLGRHVQWKIEGGKWQAYWVHVDRHTPIGGGRPSREVLNWVRVPDGVDLENAA